MSTCAPLPRPPRWALDVTPAEAGGSTVIDLIFFRLVIRYSGFNAATGQHAYYRSKKAPLARNRTTLPPNRWYSPKTDQAESLPNECHK